VGDNITVERTHNGVAMCCSRAVSQHTTMPLTTDLRSHLGDTP